VGRPAGAGITSPWGKHPRRRSLTLEEQLAGKKIDYPPAQDIVPTPPDEPECSVSAAKGGER